MLKFHAVVAPGGRFYHILVACADCLFQLKMSKIFVASSDTAHNTGSWPDFLACFNECFTLLVADGSSLLSQNICDRLTLFAGNVMVTFILAEPDQYHKQIKLGSEQCLLPNASPA